MHHKKIAAVLELSSKICAAAIAGTIVFSTALTVFLFPFATLLNLTAGNWRSKFKSIFQNPVALIFLFFYSMFIIGSTYSTGSWHDSLLMLQKYDKFLFAALLFPMFTEKKFRDLAVNVFLVTIFVMLVISYVKTQAFPHMGAKYGVVEVFKTRIEFNFLMAFAAYLCFFRIATDRRYRFVWVTFLLMIMQTIFFRSAGRDGYIIFIGLTFLFFIQKFQLKGLLIAFISTMLVVSASYVFSPVFKARMNDVMSDIKTYHKTDNTSVGLRISFMKNAWHLVKKRPFFGTGAGSFVHEYASITPPPTVLTHNPHNEYLFIATQFGIIGFVVLLLLFGVPLWYSQFLDNRSKYMVRGVVCGIMLGCFANSWLLDTTEGHFYAYFVAIAFAALEKKKLVK